MGQFCRAFLLVVCSVLLPMQSSAQDTSASHPQDDAEVLRAVQAATDEAIEAAVSAMPPRTDQRPDSVIFCEDMTTAATTLFGIKAKGQSLTKAIEYVDFVWIYDKKRHVVASGLALVILRDASIQSLDKAVSLAGKACRNES